MSNLYSQTRSFNLGIAHEFGIEAALIYDDLVYAQHTVGRETGWFYRSYQQMLLRLPLMCERTARNRIRALEKAGWIKTKVKKVDGAPTIHFQVVRYLTAPDTVTSEPAPDAVSSNKQLNKTTKIGISAKDSTNAIATLIAKQPAQLIPALEEFVEHRKLNKKAPLTPLALQKIISKLQDMYPDNIASQVASLDESIMNGWTGVFPLNRKETASQPKEESLIEKLNREIAEGKRDISGKILE